MYKRQQPEPADLSAVSQYPSSYVQDFDDLEEVTHHGVELSELQKTHASNQATPQEQIFSEPSPSSSSLDRSASSLGSSNINPTSIESSHSGTSNSKIDEEEAKLLDLFDQSFSSFERDLSLHMSGDTPSGPPVPASAPVSSDSSCLLYTSPSPRD